MSETAAKQAKLDCAKHTLALRQWLQGRHYYKAMKALEFARITHSGVRKDGFTPEFDHPLRVAQYIRTIENSLLNPQETIVAALLHDIVEDYVSLETIEAIFGAETRKNVDLLSKKSITFAKPIAVYFAELETSPVASIVKCADRTHNQHSMPGVFSIEKQIEYVEETEKYFLPMCKAAKRRFPEQEQAYENVKAFLQTQVKLLKLVFPEPAPAAAFSP